MIFIALIYIVCAVFVQWVGVREFPDANSFFIGISIIFAACIMKGGANVPKRKGD